MDTQEVVVVTIQYRLGVLGFLAGDHPSCKGNFGLKDQNMALRWINENIHKFSGDPDRVTLMGESAGAASVHLHMMSKQSNGLFHRGIMSSGSALAHWALIRTPKQLFDRLAAVAGITDPNPEEVMIKLRGLTAEQLVVMGLQLPNIHPAAPNFRPVIEKKWKNAFLTSDPHFIWESGRFERRPFLIGRNGYEEGTFHDLYFNETMRNGLLANFDQLIVGGFEVPPSALPVIKNFYFNGMPTQENSINILGVGL